MNKLTYPLGILLFGISACSVNKTTKVNQVEFPAFSAEAHRVGSDLVPEHTIQEKKDAMTYPAVNTLEMDTHINKDGKVIVTNDDYLHPGFMLTPYRQEIPTKDSKKYSVFKMDYSLLKTFDI